MEGKIGDMQCNQVGAHWMTNPKIPVLIVGAGPVGLALAGDLGWRGVQCCLVEKSDGSIYQPKMDMVGIRTMEFCRRWGIASWVENSPYPRDYPQDNVWVESLTGFEFGRERMPTKDEEPCPPQSAQKRERCPQDMFDPILRRFASQFGVVEFSYRTELVDFSETKTGVLATLRDPKGAQYHVACDYLVGTDGAASVVREKLGIPMHGEPVLTYTTNVIFRCRDLPSLHDKGKAYRFIFIGPEGTWLTIVAIDGANRWRMSIIGDKSKREISETEIRALILRAMGKPFEFEIESIMPWARRELVAESFGTERVFLAGDACHLMSPTGGFGMNTGIADVIDLSWKLEGVIKGWGGPELLRSYGIERKPVAERAVKEASANLGRMLAARRKAPPEIAFRPGPEGEAARREYGDWYTEIIKQEWYSTGIHLGFNYYHSPVVCPDGSTAAHDQVSNYVQTGRPGHRAPHVWLKDGSSTLDLFGRGFVLLCFASDRQAGSKSFVEAAKDRDVPLKVVGLDEGREAYGADYVLVRPDGHVAWRGNSPPEDVGSIIDTVRGFGKATERSLPKNNRLSSKDNVSAGSAH
jgi:2-polyprenyl-6-methoxyphenol hydroxylase-like FAD-dependent oxidoreductase